MKLELFETVEEEERSALNESVFKYIYIMSSVCHSEQTGSLWNILCPCAASETQRDEYEQETKRAYCVISSCSNHTGHYCAPVCVFVCVCERGYSHQNLCLDPSPRDRCAGSCWACQCQPSSASSSCLWSSCPSGIARCGSACC